MRVCFLLLVLGVVACGAATRGPAPIAWPADWGRFVGQTVTVEGTSVNAKLGALLFDRDGERSIWIDGLQSWPEGFYRGDNDGHRVRVTGKVVMARDLPVFVREPGEPEIQGMPVPAGTDLDEASKRYLLADARWVVVD